MAEQYQEWDFVEPGRGHEMSHDNGDFTIEHTLATLERDNVICHSTAQVLRQMLKRRQEPTKDAACGMPALQNSSKSPHRAL